jgi:hypothetical protein
LPSPRRCSHWRQPDSLLPDGCQACARYDDRVRLGLGGFLKTNGLPSRNVVRILSQQDVDRVLRLADLPFEIGDLRICHIEHLPGLKHIKRRRHTVLEAQLGKLHRIVLGAHCCCCDLKLQVEIAEQTIIARDVAHQCQDYGLLCTLRG